MNLRLLLVICTISTLAACDTGTNHTVQDAATATEPQVTPAALRAHVSFLADDLLKGRGNGTEGYEIAALYVANQFAAMGLEPAGVDGSYYQNVPLRESRLVEGSGHMSIERAGVTTRLVYAEDFLMSGDPLRANSTVKAPVVFVGFGVTAPDRDYDDYAGVDVKGKIVAIIDGAPPTFGHNERAYYSSSLVKYPNAVAHGAVGIIGFLTPEREKRVTWERRVIGAASPGMRSLDTDGNANNTYSEIVVSAGLSRQGLEKLFVAAPKTLDEVFASARNGVVQSFDLPVEVSLRRSTEHREMSAPNVAAVLRGSDPELQSEYVVFTGHLDHMGVSVAVDGDAIYNGAFDNAMGISVMIEAAKAMAGNPPRRSVMFLAVAAEEKGLLGSDFFAENPTVPIENVVANVNIDMPVMLGPLLDIVAFGSEHTSLSLAVDSAAASLGLVQSEDPFPEEVVFIRSDQYSFVRRGVPAIFLVPGMKSALENVPDGQQFGHFLRDTYHTAKDDMTQSFDWNAAVNFTLANLEIGTIVANADERPTWNREDFFGDKFAGSE